MWSRTQPFEQSTCQLENWEYKGKGYPVVVTHGKPVDIISLKLNMVEDFQNKVDIISKSRKEIYAGNLHPVNDCPICHQKKLRKALQVYGAQYVQCENCTHYFVNAIPTKEALTEFYKNDKEYQSTYADPKTTETRLNQVAIPKVKWVIEQYERLYSRKPRTILDIGAGSGHFVKACRDLGIAAVGIEPSIMGRKFASLNLGVELVDANFTLDWGQFKGYDIVTFWGVLEHVTNPMTFLDVAKKVVSKKNLVVAEVPRWNCLSTTIQTIFPNSIVRHLDPLGHIQCFTDSSLATAFAENGYSPVACWIFGMDAYELITQLTLRSPDVRYYMDTSIPQIQERLDLAKLSDEIVICAKV
jgi:2-polyprenyl-3-methyl-5-hydroxy-6-metoxy-1,4-benzoquinol methylase